jgi:AcrR family transcriptional regulator
MFAAHFDCVRHTLSSPRRQGVQVHVPYPSKTDRNAILSAAVEELSRAGIRDLSLRNIAATLDLAPNALYRYFSDRAALEAALADECARQLGWRYERLRKAARLRKRFAR